MSDRRGHGALFPSRVVVDLPNWLGDLVMALPALQRILEANRDGASVVLTRPSTARLVGALFPDSEVVATARREGAMTTGRGLRRRFGVFDLGVTFRNAARAKVMLRTAARSTVGSRSQGGRLLLSYSPPADRNGHQVFDQDPLLKAVGLPPVDADWRPRFPACLEDEGRALLARVLGDGSAVGLAPGVAGGEIKRWSPIAFGELAGRLDDTGLRPVVLVGPGEEGLARRVADASPVEVPVLGLDQDAAGLAGLAAGLAAVVGNDSGAGHVAALAGTPVVSLFGPTDPRRTAPRGSAVTLCRREVVCAPCGRRRCSEPTRVCLDDLKVDTVFDAVRPLVRELVY
jgi:heptosyltransferase-2